jgi:hypothetical protein
MYFCAEKFLHKNLFSKHCKNLEYMTCSDRITDTHKLRRLLFEKMAYCNLTRKYSTVRLQKA